MVFKLKKRSNHTTTKRNQLLFEQLELRQLMSTTPVLSPPPSEFIAEPSLVEAEIAAPLTSNWAPMVYAGSDLTTSLGNDVMLNGETLVNLARSLTVTWSMVSGPGTVVFADSSDTSTTASFSTAGTYELALTVVNDGITVSDDLTITVTSNVSAGLVGSWDFEEGNGSTTADASGSGHDGIVGGAEWTTTGKVGNALRFDGSNDFIDTGKWDVDSGQLTIATWFKADDFGVSDARLLSKATGVAEQDHYWMLSTINSNGSKLRFRLKADGTTKTLIADAGNLVAGEWMHAAAVYDGAMMRLYLNGTEVGATPHSGQVSSNANVPVSIGSNPGGTKPFDGLIDQVRVYDRALTPEEISAIIAQASAVDPDTITVEYPQNNAPTVDAGADRTVELSEEMTLQANVEDDGLPTSSSVELSALAYQLDQDLGLEYMGSFFSDWGDLGEKWLLGDDSSLFYITYDGSFYHWNGDTDLSDSEQIATFNASYYDNPELIFNAQNPINIGQPVQPLTIAWSTVSGPGDVTFGNSQTVDTTVSFSQTGDYVLRLEAYDGEFTTSDDVTITVDYPPNSAPAVDAGADGSVVVSAAHALDGTVSDDGLPKSPGTVTTTWSTVSGPGAVTFDDTSAVDTTASFTQAGNYVLRLEANDGEFTVSDDLTITVTSNVSAGLVGSWDFEEGNGSTTADVSGSGHDGVLNGAVWTTTGKVGNALRFDGSNDFIDTGKWDVDSGQLTIATWFKADDFGVSDARLLSKATGVAEQDHYWMLSTINSNGSKLRFRLKADGTTKTLIADAGNLVAGEWMHAAAVYDGAMMRLYLNGTEVGATPHSGQVSANASVPVSIGSNPGGTKPFDGLIDQVRVYDRALTPEEISALIGQTPVTNQAPGVNAGPNRSVVVSAALALDGTVSDDGLPNPPATVTTTWSQVSGPGAVTFGDTSASDTTASFTQIGTYVLQLEANDGELVGSDTVTVTVNNEVQVSGFFVSPNGNSGGDGSINNPWDLQTALNQPSAVRAGATIWLRDGTYRTGKLVSNLTGTAASPIIVRAYPGERPKLDLWLTNDQFDRGFDAYGDYVHYRDLEFFMSDPASRISPTSGSGSVGISGRSGRIHVRGSYNKFINNIVHDMVGGIGFWEDGAGGEVYGNIIYNNGWLAPDRGHGNGLYVGNELDTKYVKDNIIFNQLAGNVQVYDGHSDGHLENIHLEGNTLFNASAGAGVGFNVRNANLLIGGAIAADDITVTENYIYSMGDKDGDIAAIDLSYNYGLTNGDLVLTDNYLVGPTNFWKPWESIQSSDNTVVGSVGGNYAPGSGLDVIAKPTGVEAFVRPNAYEAGRGHVTIYNWDAKSSVDVDLSSVLAVGADYEIRHVYNILDGPVLITGTYDGSPVTIPMRATQAPALLGNTAPQFGLSIGAPVTTGPEFGVFVVTTVPKPATPLLAAGGAASDSADVDDLTTEAVQSILDYAIQQWAATGISDEQMSALSEVAFEIVDLEGARLGEATSSGIVLDTNAANHGWFVDPTPELNNEFIKQGELLVADSNGDSANRIDLLTVVMHELGHVLGYNHANQDEEMDVMSETLNSGIRKGLDSHLVDIIFAD